MAKEIRCQCDEQGIFNPRFESWFDPVTELPFVDHQPGECQCTNDLKLYRRSDSSVKYLCSCCHSFGDVAIGNETP